MALLSDAFAQARADLPQCDELCGPFWAASTLRAAGFNVTQEEAAVAAGSILAPPGSPSSLPPGEPGRRPSIALPVGDPAGTSAHGVARAIEQLSGGALSVVPASGHWTADRLLALLEGLDELVVIANVFTGALSDDWEVGHFLAVAEASGSTIVLRDSYASRREHSHPAERVAAALEGRGLLIVTEEPEDVHARVFEVGLQPHLWDNGSPMPG